MAAEESAERIRRIEMEEWKMRLLFGFIVWVAVGLLALSLLLAYWRFVSPVPSFRVLESRVTDLDGDSFSELDRPGAFEVRRLIESKMDAKGRISAFFRTRPPPHPLIAPDGREVMPDAIEFQIAEADDYLTRGTHWRSRVWETPRILPPGEYVYQSVVRFCNPLRCDDVKLPAVDVTLRGPAAPVR